MKRWHNILSQVCYERARGYMNIISGLVSRDIRTSRDHFAKLCRALVAQTLSKEGFSNRMIAKCMGCSNANIYLLKKIEITEIAGIAEDFNKRKYDIHIEPNSRAVEVGGCL